MVPWFSNTVNCVVDSKNFTVIFLPQFIVEISLLVVSLETFDQLQLNNEYSNWENVKVILFCELSSSIGRVDAFIL